MLTTPTPSPIPPGPWAAAVSGGADSTALLLLCRPHIAHIIHLNHELRGDQASEDAHFVRTLATHLAIPATINTISALTTNNHQPSTSPATRNSQLATAPATSADFRLLRHRLYRDVVQAHNLAGVLLAHHADDDAETIAQRLLRGSGFRGLRGIPRDVTVNGVRIFRPLLHTRKSDLIAYLQSHHHPWREDASNATPAYGRNRVRLMLAANPQLHPALLALKHAAATYADLLDQHAPQVSSPSPVAFWSSLPRPQLRASARRALAAHVPEDELTDTLVERFLTWAADAASPRDLELPGKTSIATRQRGQIHLKQRPQATRPSAQTASSPERPQSPHPPTPP